MRRSILGLIATAVLAGTQLVAPHAAEAAAKCVKGDRKPPFTVGWANIYSVPTWMKQTEATRYSRTTRLRLTEDLRGMVDCGRTRPLPRRRPGYRLPVHRPLHPLHVLRARAAPPAPCAAGRRGSSRP